jgi:hypothetical protein
LSKEGIARMISLQRNLVADGPYPLPI